MTGWERLGIGGLSQACLSGRLGLPAVLDDALRISRSRAASASSTCCAVPSEPALRTVPGYAGQ